MNKRILFFFIFCICGFQAVLGQTAIFSDSIRISLLTVYPRPNKVYTVFGHTAIRVSGLENEPDLVFNFGMFDFRKPNFIYRFVKGETDYMLGIDDFDSFRFAYAMDNSTVVEQVLNIPLQAKEKIVEDLLINARPENREYRYNYFFDNCTTRPRDIIENNTGGELIYPERKEKTTLRTLVHQCTGAYPWLTFGIDLVIGSGADSLIGLRTEMFLPLRLKESLDESVISYIYNSGEKAPVVSAEYILMQADNDPSQPGFGITPAIAGIFLLIITGIFVFLGIRKRRRFRLFFGFLYLIALLAGLLVAYLSFVSIHPCTWPNWNLLWLHPLYIIPFIGCFFKKTYLIEYLFHWVNFILLSLFLLLWGMIPQEINSACIPFIICLGLSSAFYLILKKIKS